MYSMVLMAALTTGIDMPDRGGRRGGCCGGGCYGGGYGMGMGYGGCYGGMGMGYGGCYGGMGMGYGGGYGGWGRGYAMNSGLGGWGYGGYALGNNWSGFGYGGYTLGNNWSGFGNYAMSPMMSTMGTPIVSAGGTMFNPAGLSSQSFYFNPTGANEATIIVHMPANANLTIDGEKTQQRGATRVFTSPALQPGKTYTYTLRAEMSRDGRTVHETKNVEVRAGQPSEVQLNFEDSGRRDER